MLVLGLNQLLGYTRLGNDDHGLCLAVIEPLHSRGEAAAFHAVADADTDTPGAARDDQNQEKKATDKICEEQNVSGVKLRMILSVPSLLQHLNFWAFTPQESSVVST